MPLPLINYLEGFSRPHWPLFSFPRLCIVTYYQGSTSSLLDNSSLTKTWTNSNLIIPRCVQLQRRREERGL